METVRVEIEWRLTTQPRARMTHYAVKGAMIGAFLHSLFPECRLEEITIVYNGKMAVKTDVIEANGTLVLIPLLCGG